MVRKSKLRCPIGLVPECGTFENREELKAHVEEEHGVQLLYECVVCGRNKLLPERTLSGSIVVRSECDSCVEKRDDPLLALYHTELKQELEGEEGG